MRGGIRCYGSTDCAARNDPKEEMRMQPLHGQPAVPIQPTQAVAQGEAELARYASILLSHKVERHVLHELLEQRRARRQVGWASRAAKET